MATADEETQALQEQAVVVPAEALPAPLAVPAKDHADHDAMYEAVFKMVGTAEPQSMEGLMSSLPTLKEPEPPEVRALVRLAAGQGLQ